VRRALAALLLLFAAALVLSPVVAALAGSGPLRITRAFLSMEREAVFPSLTLAGVAGATALLLGFPFGILVGGTRVPFRRTLLATALLGLTMPPYLTAASWIDLLGPAGRIPRVLGNALGLETQNIEEARLGVYRFSGFIYSAPAAGLVLGFCLFPLVALAVASADRRLDRRLLDAARLARGSRGAWRVSLSLLLPPALGAALIVFAASLTEFAVPQVLRIRSLGEDVFSRFEEGHFGHAAALGLPLVAIVLVAGLVGGFLLSRRRLASAAGLEGDAARFSLREAGLAGRLLAVTLGGLAVAPGVLFPLVSFAIQMQQGPPGETGGFVAALARAWATAGGDAVRTVLLSALSATFALALAIPLGRLLARPSRLSSAFTGLLATGLAVPAPVVGLGLIVIWNHDYWIGPFHPTAFVYDNGWAVVLGWLSRFFPLALLLVRAGFSRVPPELEEAAALAGHRGGARFRSVALPLATPGIVAAWLAVYVLSATEFGATVLTLAPGKPLLAVTVVNLIHYGQDAVIAASAFLLLGTVLLPLVPAALLVALVRKR
jgi:iron(III) transport system permease protein